MYHGPSGAPGPTYRTRRSDSTLPAAYNPKARDDRYSAASSLGIRSPDVRTREEAPMAKIRVYTTPT